MYITPNQRRRSMKAHYLQRKGKTISEIAEQLEVSRSTVRSDLKLVETHWGSIAAAAADDLLLDSLYLLQLRLDVATRSDVLKAVRKHLSPAEILQAHEAQQTQLNNLAREIRRTVQEVHRRADERPNRPDLFEEEDPQESAQTNPKLPISATPKTTKPSPQHEIINSEPTEEKIPTKHVKHPDPVGPKTKPKPKTYAEAAG